MASWNTCVCLHQGKNPDGENAMARINRNKSERVPKQMQPTFDAIVALTDSFCDKHLNEEYKQLVRQATAALCRKRPSPLVRGRTDIWACGIVHAMGLVNFLADSSKEPYMSTADLCNEFGVNQSTASTKSKAVRDILGMHQMDPNWCLPSMLDRNPLVWMIMVDDLIVDARWMPYEVQEIAYEKGLIPYIPGEK
jgi:hypothetical protein